jgi:xanthine dehydrogenase YagS FAD-binding subunit
VKAFAYVRPKTVEAAVAALSEGGTLKGNGLDLLDRLKERVDEPERVVTLGDVPGLARIAPVYAPPGVGGGGGLSPWGIVIGAMATLADVAASKEVRATCPALADAASEAASPQLRNRATVGGNLAQHTRCGYYRHKTFPCWKRGSESCPVLVEGAVQETAAVFGNSACASAHPSSLAPVLCAVDAWVAVRGPKGERRIPVADLYEAPRRGKPGDTVLAEDDVIVGVGIQNAPQGAFMEVRRRAAFDWALVSCAVSLSEADGKVSKAGIWLGSVAPTPWRAKAAEDTLVGKPFSEAAARAAGEAAATGATPLPGNRYKVDLVKVVVRRALLAAHGRR